MSIDLREVNAAVQGTAHQIAADNAHGLPVMMDSRLLPLFDSLATASVEAHGKTHWFARGCSAPNCFVVVGLVKMNGYRQRIAGFRIAQCLKANGKMSSPRNTRSAIWLAALISFSGSLSAVAQTPQWLAADQLDELASVTFRQRLVPTEGVQQAQLKIAVDFAQAAVRINGKTALQLEPYCSLQSLDVTSLVQRGDNLIEIELQGVPGPTAMACELVLQLVSGAQQRLVSDGAWQCQLAADSVWLTAVERGAVPAEQWGTGRRDISLAATENYEQWRQAQGGSAVAAKPRLWTPPGFEVQILHTASEHQGSWIAMAFDPQGRLLVSREDQGFLRLTLASDAARVAEVETLESQLLECRGLAFQGPHLYANANSSRGLYRVEFDGAGPISNSSMVREFPGGTGHGRNDLLVSGDYLYTIHGDSVDLPTEQILDLTSPWRHNQPNETRREGQLLRMQLESHQWELISGGLRNPYGVAAIADGRLVSFDADNEYDTGTPWYRPTRLIPLLTGGDIGYRTANRNQPPRYHDQPENVPPILTIGRSSPTAICYDPNFRFPTPYRRATYLLDWTYGRVLAIHLDRRGAGYRANAELFLQGRPLNVTDICCGPDGAMYLITGGRKTQSSLLRVIATEPGPPDETSTRSISAHELAAAQFSERQTAVYQQLEQVVRSRDARQLPLLVSHIADPDPNLRHVARIALERLPLDAWGTQIMEVADETSWLYGTLALLQTNAAPATAIMARWLSIEPALHNLTEQIVWLRLLELCHAGHSQVTEPLQPQILQKLQSAWDSGQTWSVGTHGTSVEYRQRCARLIAEFSFEAPLPNCFRELLTSPRQEDRLTALVALQKKTKGWTAADRQLQLTALRDAHQMLGGEGLPALLSAIKQETLASLPEGERPAAEQLLASNVTAAPSSMAPRPMVRAWDLPALASLIQAASLVDQADQARADQGREVFHQAMCAQCHRIGREGAAIGPELTHVAQRFGTRDLLDSIVNPSHSVAEQYQLDAVQLVDGTVHIGRIVQTGDYRSEQLMLQQDVLRADSLLAINKRDIEDHQRIDRSPMPEGLLNSFNLEEIRDLLVYLQSAGSAK